MGRGSDADNRSPSSVATETDFEAAYQASRKKLHGIAAAMLRRGGLESHTEDVVMKAIVELWPRRAEKPRSWEALMATVVKRRAIDVIREATKQADPLPARHDDDEDADDRFEPANPHDFAIEHSEAADVRAAVRSLPDKQEREVLYRMYYLKHTQTEVADEFGLSRGRISQVHTSALRNLEAVLRAGERGDPHDRGPRP